MTKLFLVYSIFLNAKFDLHIITYNLMSCQGLANMSEKTENKHMRVTVSHGVWVYEALLWSS